MYSVGGEENRSQCFQTNPPDICALTAPLQQHPAHEILCNDNKWARVYIALCCASVNKVN